MTNKIIKILGLLVIVSIMIFLGLKLWEMSRQNDDLTFSSFVSKKTTPSLPLTFTLGGDVMLGRAVAYGFDNDVTQAFKKLGPDFFGKVDLGLINLEGPIAKTNITPNPTANNLVFNFPLNSVDALKYLGLNAVSLGNNHSQNQGLQGLNTTRELLSNQNIVAIGSQTAFDDYSLARFGDGKKKLAVLTINCLETENDITSNIKAEKAAGHFVLVFPHWGNEYQTKHSASQEKLAHLWIDAGADLVIGSHPHVTQDAEVYLNKPIFYSLGNLVFDQPFSLETQRGLILKGEISESNIKIQILPTKINRNQVSLLENEDKTLVLDQFKSRLGQEIFLNDTFTLKQ